MGFKQVMKWIGFGVNEAAKVAEIVPMPQFQVLGRVADALIPDANAAPSPRPMTREEANSKWPELMWQINRLKEEKAGLDNAVEPLRRQREELLNQIRPALGQITAIEKEIKKSQPRIAALDNQIGALARAMGARAMSAGGNVQ